MGLFQHRPEEHENHWAGLPSEPREHSGADVLEETPSVDPTAVSFGGQVTSIVFPVAPPPAAEFALENREPDDTRDR